MVGVLMSTLYVVRFLCFQLRTLSVDVGDEKSRLLHITLCCAGLLIHHIIAAAQRPDFAHLFQIVDHAPKTVGENKAGVLRVHLQPCASQ